MFVVVFAAKLPIFFHQPANLSTNSMDLAALTGLTDLTVR